MNNNYIMRPNIQQQIQQTQTQMGMVPPRMPQQILRPTMQDQIQAGMRAPNPIGSPLRKLT